MTSVTDNTKALGGEPALIIGAIVSVLQIVAAILAGTTETVDGSTAIAGVVIPVIFTIAGAFATRSKVTPVSTAPQADAL